jgi:hypothetical protein
MPALQIIMVTVYEDSERLFRRVESGRQRLLRSSPVPRTNCWKLSAMFIPAVPPCRVTSRGRSCSIFICLVLHPRSREFIPSQAAGLALLASGFIYKEIADKLEIGGDRPHPVKSICQKMHVRNRRSRR